MPQIKYCLCVLVALPLALSATTEGIYSWVDDNGERHFSDTPVEGAQPFELGPINTFNAPDSASAPAAAPVSPPAASDQEQSDEPAYNDFQISSPAPDDVLWNTGGVVSVTLTLSPRLKGGDKIRLLLDGAEVKSYPGRSLSHQITEVDRGTHSLRAVIVARSGKQLAATQAVTFTVQQNSVLNQNNPNNFPVPRGGL
ncbi:MAG: DUF4124 domain-containing protein [Gammaproteobacteria bacterium]|nr:DUF4124 domain-containing protein [Gammaproteobacteria bacterium]